MDDDEQRPAKKYPISIAKLSKTPSWIMLGFVLGALFVIALPPMGGDKPAAEPAKPVEPPKVAMPPEPTQLTTIEAVFEDPRWKEFTFWSNDTTEVALWNHDAKQFSDFYEVRRFGGVNYYRSIPSLTRPIVKNMKALPDDCPLRFTAAVADEIYRDNVPARTEQPAERGWKPQPHPLPQVTLPSAQMPSREPPSVPKIEMRPPPEK